MQIDVKTIKGWPELQAAMRDFSERRVQAAMATALTRTVKQLASNWQQQINAQIDRPNPRTQSATMFKSATAQSLQASVLVKDQQAGTPAAAYLLAQQLGGRRDIKQFEKALISSGAMPSGYVTVPGKGAQLDGFGGVSRSQIIAVLTALGSEYTPGYARVISKSTAKRLATLAKRGRQYTVVQPGEERKANADAGIYERQANGQRKAIFLFKRATSYTKRLDLLQVTQDTALAILSDEAARAVAESAAKLAAKGAA